MAMFTFEEQCMIICFLHLRGMKPIEIHQQLSETCSDGVMDVKNVHLWVREFKEGWMLCENKPKGPWPRTSRSEEMIARVEQMVTEDRRLTVKQIAANAGISIGSVDTILHDDLKMFLPDGFRECWPMKTRLHASQCVRQSYHVTRVWIVLFFINCQSGWDMDADVQSWNQTAFGSMEAHQLTATEEISGYCQCWENDGSHVLGQRRHNTCSLHSQEYNSDGWDLWRCVMNAVSSSIAWKTAPKGRSCVLSSWQCSSSSGGWFLPVFRWQQLWSCSSCSVLTWSRTKRFLAVSNTEGHFMVAHFQVVPLLQQQFSSAHNEPLKKHLLRPCNQGVNVVKNVYVYRVITLRNDCIFSFLGWVIFFK